MRSMSLVCEGAVWRVEDDGRVARVRDQVGMRHLARLLGQPGVALSAMVLCLDGDPEATSAAQRGGTGAALDARAKAEYRDRIATLREQLTEAEQWGDLGRQQRAKEELDALSRELARSVGVGGRDRVEGAPAERFRVRVTKALQRAVAAIAKELPSLGAHLEDALRTGTSCVYDPRHGAPRWTLDPGGARRS